MRSTNLAYPFRSSALIFAVTLSIGGSVACSSKTTGSLEPIVAATITSPAPSSCGPGAIAEIGANYALDGDDPKSVWVDSSGVLLNLTDTSGDGAVLVSGTTAGDFSAVFTLPAGTFVTAGATASTVFFADLVPDAPTVESIPRAGGQPTSLGDADPLFLNLALGANVIYEATLSGISSMPTAGGSMAVIHSGGTAMNVLVSPDGGSLYWITGNTGGPYYVRTASLSGTFTATTVATMPDYTVVSRMAVGGGQIVVVGTTLPIGTSTTYAASLYTVSTSGGTPVVVDTLPVKADASAAASTGLALSGDAAYYSLGAGLKKVALDGSNSVTAVTAASTVIAGVGANPSAGGVVYVVGQCVYAGE
jgi:hypothetical protein